MDEDSETSNPISRRSVITHFAAGLSGWLLGAFLDPFRRRVNSVIADTPFGRRAQIGFGYAASPNIEGEGYMVQISNSGRETAENLSAHIGFEEEITASEVEDWVNSPPAPDVDIEVLEGGVVRLEIDFVRRNISEHLNPLRIHFSVEEGTQSNLAFRLDEEEVMFVAYRYSWTFLGERYYESTEHHIVREI